MDIHDFQDRGDTARREQGIDGTAGDAQDIRHRYVTDPQGGGCLLCGLAETYRQHIDRPLDCGFCYEENGEEVHPHPECPIGRVAPSAAPVVRPELRDQIAALFRHPPGAERLGDATPGEIADAVLSVLPATTNWAAEEAYRLALSQALGLGTGANWEAIRDRAEDLVAEVAELTEARRRFLAQQQGADGQAAALNQAADFFRGLHITGTTITAAEAEGELCRMAVEAQQQTETSAPGTEPGCTRCGHSRERHMGDEGERGCYTCWDLPGNSGWNHPFHVRDTDQPAVVAAVAGQEPADETQTLAAMFEGLHTLLATSSRDWSTYRVDAWLWAVLCGWDCEQAVHDEMCTHGAMEEMQQQHGWDDEAVAKARRYRAAVRAIENRAAVSQPGKET